jgi:hypothetical protein
MTVLGSFGQSKGRRMVPELVEGHRTLHYEFIDPGKDEMAFESE